jgi:hypothetical protein
MQTGGHFKIDEFGHSTLASAESSFMFGRGRGSKRGREKESSKSSSSPFGDMDMEDNDELARKGKEAAMHTYRQDLEGKSEFCGKDHTAATPADGIIDHFGLTSGAPLVNLTGYKVSIDCAMAEAEVGASCRGSDDEIDQNPYPNPKWYNSDYYKENGGDEIWGTHSSDEGEWGWDADAADEEQEREKE